MNKQKNATNPSSFSIINFEGNIENNSAFTNPDQHSNSMSQSESQFRSMSQPQSISQSRSMSNSDDYDTPYSTESISNQYNQKLSLQSYSNKDTSNTNNSINTEPLNSASKNNTFNSELPSTDFEPPKSVPTSSNLTLNTSHELSDTTLTLLHNTNIGPSTMPLYYRNHQHPLFDRNIIITAQQSPTTILPQAIKLSHSKSNQEKPYRCNHCKTSFARFHDLKRHSKKHTQDPKTHYCKDCDKSFARKDSLMRHLNRLTTDGKLSCLKKNLESKWVDAFVKGQNLRNNHNIIHSNESMADEQNCDKNAHANEDSFETSDTTSRVSKEIDLDKVGSKARIVDLETVEYKASVMDLDDKVFYRDDHEMDILMDLNEEVNEDEEMILLPTHQYHTQKENSVESDNKERASSETTMCSSSSNIHAPQSNLEYDQTSKSVPTSPLYGNLHDNCDISDLIKRSSTPHGQGISKNLIKLRAVERSQSCSNHKSNYSNESPIMLYPRHLESGVQRFTPYSSNTISVMNTVIKESGVQDDESNTYITVDSLKQEIIFLKDQIERRDRKIVQLEKEKSILSTF